MDSQACVHQLRFSAWATRRVLDSVAPLPADELHRKTGSSFGSIHDTLVHIFQADSIWWDRLMLKATADLSVYDPPAEYGEFVARWLALHDTYVGWGNGLGAGEWDRIVPHRNIKGEPFEAPVWQIVLHVVNHASYHRGQITTLLRQLGREPVGTDLITYYRSLGGERHV
jgi:uncharacterized damage-inducible protein DinB